MNKILIIVFSVYMIKSATAYCCYRDPWILPTAPCINTYTMANPCTNTCECSTNMATNCYTPCKCFRDPANICETCDKPSPMCQCLSNCGCDGLKYPLYFPEVVYPATIIEMEPFYYKTCFTY